MRKLTFLFMLAGLIGFMACGGPSAEEKAAAESAKMDSVAQAAAEEAEQAILDSIAIASEEAEQQAKLDSLEQALEAEKNKKATPAKTQTDTKIKKEESKEEAPAATPSRKGATRRGG